MNLADPEILFRLISNPDVGFGDAYNKMRHPKKGEMIDLLLYLDKILGYMLGREADGLRCTQIHFPELYTELKDILLEFLIIRSYHRSLEGDREEDDHIPARIRTLENKLVHSQAPEDAKGKNGGNMAYKRWMAKMKSWKDEINVLRSIANSRRSLRPDTVINLPVGDMETLGDNFYALTLEELKEGARRAYCILNADLSRDDLFKHLHEQGWLTRIRQILLFDCESRQNSYSYNRRTLEEMIGARYAMKDLVVLSFDKKPFRLQHLINKLNIFYKNFFLPPQKALDFRDTYVVAEEEADLFISRQPFQRDVGFIGCKSELFADFTDLVSTYRADKLRSLPVLNIFAACINDRLSRLIVSDLFGDAYDTGLFDPEVRVCVGGLDPRSKEALRTAVDTLLQLVIAEWEQIAKRMQAEQPGSVGVIVPLPLLENVAFRRALRDLVPHLKLNFYSWKDMREEQNKDHRFIVLAYRDAGQYPFPFYPSLIERGPNRCLEFQPLLLGMFFQARFDRNSWSYQYNRWRILNNEFRRSCLDWKSAGDRIQHARPSHFDESSVDEETDELADSGESIRVDYHDEGHTTFYPSRPVIIREEPGGPLSVVRADELPETADRWAIQALDELYEDLNLFQITADEEQELLYIKRSYGVEDRGIALWKELLSRKARTGTGKTALYEAIAKLLEEPGFIRYEHFRDHWLDPESELLIPRRRRHFKLICEYLGLPRAYYRLELKKRSSVATSSRQSNSKMNLLLTQMINEGLFEPDLNWQTLPLQHLLDGYELEEKGITRENINEELRALVHLMRDKFSLKEVQKIERP